jgi:DNA polymerase-4
MNAYFASVEQASNPFFRGKPIAVGGGAGGKRTVVAACSYEAKARGVKNAMPSWEAQKICPDLIMVAGDMTKYIYTSSEIMKMLRDYTPLVEVFSIDEAFMDVTGTKERFGGAVRIAKEIKKRIRERFRLTGSIGISYNKLMAKLAGELKKPDGLTIIRPEDVPDKLENLPVSKLCGIGRKIEQYLADIGIKTFGDINRYPSEKQVKRFGAACGEQLYLMGQGKDKSEVLAHHIEEEARSMGHSYTLPKFTKDIDEVKSYLLRLAEQVGRRLRRDNYRGNVIHVSLGFAYPPKLEERRWGDYKFWGKQKKIEDYIDDGFEIYKVAERIMNDGRGTCLAGRQAMEEERGFRFVGVSLSNLVHNLDQVSIFELEERKKMILRSVDEINDRYGEFTVERASIMNTVLQKKSGMVSSRAFHYGY